MQNDGSGLPWFSITWCNRDPPNTTRVRLDRGVATLEWLHKFSATLVEPLDVTNSNHKCLRLEFEPRNSASHPRKPFRFEEIWTSDVGCEATIQEAWDKNRDGTSMFQVVNKLKDCKKGLGKWSRRHFGNVTCQLSKKCQQLKEAEVSALQGGSMDRLKSLKYEVNFLLEKERMSRQKSRSSWLKDGDQNTRFFHGRAS